MQKILMLFILALSLTAFGSVNDFDSHHGGGGHHGGGHGGGGHGGGYPSPSPYVYQCMAQSPSGSQYYGRGYTQNDAANNALNICYQQTRLVCQIGWCR